MSDMARKRSVQAFINELLIEFKSPAEFGWLTPLESDADRAYAENVLAPTASWQLLKFINGLIDRGKWKPSASNSVKVKFIKESFDLAKEDEAILRAELKKSILEKRNRFKDRQQNDNDAKKRAASEKLEAGRYTFDEAATAISAHGEDRNRLYASLVSAAQQRKLPFYMHSQKQRAPISRMPSFHDELYWNDLNNWLITDEPRIEFRFPAPARFASGSNADSSKPKASWNDRAWAIGLDVTAQYPAWGGEKIAGAVQAEMKKQGIKGDRNKTLGVETIRKALAGLKKTQTPKKDCATNERPKQNS